MHSTAILRGIVDVQAEEMVRLMSLVEHLTACLEQSQAREKAALQRCSELEIAAATQVPASWRAGHSMSMSLSLSPPAATTSTTTTTTTTTAVVATSEESPDAREHSDTYVCDVLYTCVFDVFYVFHVFHVFRVFFVCSVSNTWDLSSLIP